MIGDVLKREAGKNNIAWYQVNNEQWDNKYEIMRVRKGGR